MVHASGEDAESAVGENSKAGLIVDVWGFLHDLVNHGGELLGESVLASRARVTAG